MNHGNGVTAEYTLPPPSARVLPPAEISTRVQVDLAALSHQGKVRENNEDHFLISRVERSLEIIKTNLPSESIPQRFAEVGYGMLVADGMGGHEAGEIASRLAITTFVNLILHTPEWFMRVGKPEAEKVMERIAERYRIVDATVREKANSDPRLTDMVPQPQIHTILADSKSSDEACQRLVNAALDNGGRDNVTVVLARYRLPAGDPGAKRESK